MPPTTFSGRVRAPTDRSGGGGDKIDGLVGKVIASRFFLEARLGRGSMGIVYRARHLRFGRSFAVKVPHAHLLENEAVCRRFDREAELAGKLQHRNIVTVVEGGRTEDGLRYLVMDYVDGPTLTDLIARGPLPGDQVMRIAKQLCDGLLHAHERGLVHRDFKPDNVIVERPGQPDENPRIFDFGIALLHDEAAIAEHDRLTTAGIVLGTPHYMAPEQASGRRIDHRIDLFALGVICYEMMTGLLPFDGDGIEVARSNMLDEVPRMSVRAPDVVVDPLLEAFARVLMSKSAADRPATALHARRLLDLIETDRSAAALALGVTLPADAENPVLAAVERASRSTIAVASPSSVKSWPAASVPIPTASDVAPPPVPDAATGDAPAEARVPIALVIAAIAVLAAAAGLIWLAS